MGVRIISLYNQIFGKLLLVKYRKDLEINKLTVNIMENSRMGELNGLGFLINPSEHMYVEKWTKQ